MKSPRATYPAPGCRYYANGTLWGVGGYGYNWSSSSNGSNIHNLDFTPTGLDPQRATGRAFGRSVRCLQE